MKKGTHEKPAVNVIFSGDGPKEFLPKRRHRQGYFFPFLFSVVLEVLGKAIREEKLL